MDYWTYDEYIDFREGVKDKPLSYICFEILYWTGLREGELLALSPADIDLDNKLISINRTYQRIGLGVIIWRTHMLKNLKGTFWNSSLPILT